VNLSLSAIIERRAAVNERIRMLADKLPMPFPAQQITIGGVPCLTGPRDRTESAGTRCIIYVHGGCFVFGAAQNLMPIIMGFCRNIDATVIAPDYSLAPEHAFPCARDQITAVYEQLLRDGFERHGIALVGESAGANLIMSSLLDLRERGMTLPAAVALISPWVDLTLSGDTAQTLSAVDSELGIKNLLLYANAYCCSVDPANPCVSPVFAAQTELPPLLIQVGTRELLLSDAVRLAEGYRYAGRSVSLEIYEGVSHSFHMDTDIPAARAASRSVAQFLHKHFDTASSSAVNQECAQRNLE
jgi:acetyl esterase/lipase